MAKVDYDTLRSNPNVSGFLNLLAESEGTAGHGDNGYNIGFGGSQFNSYAAHPNITHSFTQTNGQQNTTTAAGRYQFLNRTWDGLASKIGAKDFSPANQDKAAIELIRQNGALDNVLTGDFTGAINKLGKVWASLPSSPYAQPKRTMHSLVDNGSIPTQIVSTGGQKMLAIPENDEEHNLMRAFDAAGHDDATQSLLTKALAQVTEARNKLSTPTPLFDNFPTELDDKLLDLIDKA